MREHRLGAYAFLAGLAYLVAYWVVNAVIVLVGMGVVRWIGG
jgi:hypothetical protein